MEAWALFQPFVWLHVSVAIQVGREVAVPHDDGRGELLVESCQQGPHGCALCAGAGVAGIAAGIEASFVADADAVLVVVLAVGSHLFQWAPVVDHAVAGDVVVLSDVLPPSPEVVCPAPLHAVPRRCLRAAAVQHYQCYCPHDILSELVYSLDKKEKNIKG